MRMVMAALESGPDALLKHMFTDCNLIAWLVEAPRSVVPTAREGDSSSTERRPCRAGCGSLGVKRTPEPIVKFIAHCSIRQDVFQAFRSGEKWRFWKPRRNSARCVYGF